MGFTQALSKTSPPAASFSIVGIGAAPLLPARFAYRLEASAPTSSARISRMLGSAAIARLLTNAIRRTAKGISERLLRTISGSIAADYVNWKIGDEPRIKTRFSAWPDLSLIHISEPTRL